MAEISGRVGWRNYVSPVPTIWNNLTHYYSADNTANDSKGSINGTLVNGATYSTGKINAGFGLDGVNDYVNVGNLFGFDGTTPFSISFIFKLNTNIANYSIKYLVGNQTRTAFPTNGTGAFLYTGDGGANNRLGFAMANNGNRLVVYIKNNLAINTFYHCVVSYNGNGLNSGLNTYINGVSEKLSVFSDSLTLPISSSSQLSTFGSTLGTSDFFNGVIDEVGVWDRALTAADVTELYNAGAGKQYVAPTTTSIITTGLVLNLDAGNAASYPGTGTTWTDLTGNGNNGTLVNGTSYNSTNGGTLVFDGVNDYVSLTNSNLPMGVSDFTWSTWFKTPSSFSSWQMLLSTSQYYAYFGSLNGALRLDFNGPGGLQSLSPNTWYNMVITRVPDPNGIKAYANGVFLGNINTNNLSLTGNMNIGNWAYNNSLGWLGNISSVQIYNRALSSTEVTNNFNALKSRYGL
jgi:hypothetical protein